ncbi:MAG TPA: ChaN family lipoprotein [Chthonomonadaceae bacterium]|nr:ChaN family lipoprotein [Chthonomonadaceae bacterium]
MEQVRIFTQGEETDYTAMMAALAGADVVFLGENHDHKQGHVLELMILEGLFRQKPDLILGLEMFERDVQLVLDEYRAGHITEAHFLQSSRPWGNYKEAYAPLVEFSIANGLPIVATNAPRRYANIVSRKGQAALRELPAASKPYLTPLPYPMDLPAEYDRQLNAIFTEGQETSTTLSASTRRMKEAQGLWDATMADSIRLALERYAGRTLLHINGCMHSDSGHGIVARLRTLLPEARIQVVTIKAYAGFPNRPNVALEELADFVLLTPEEE